MARKQPHILFISCDQQRWDCLGFQQRYPVCTPHIDRLAAEGISFDHSYTPLPTCCPSRQSLVCGRRPERFGALWNFDQGIPVSSLPASAFSWARALQEAGYHTGYVGKWHVSPTLTPLDFGYETYIPEQEFHRQLQLRHPGLSYHKGFFGEKSPYPLQDAPTHQCARQVIRLIDQYAEDGERPWHIKMDLSEPHLPCRPCEPFASMYDHVPMWHAFQDPLEGKPYMHTQMRLNWGTQDLSWEACREMVKLYYGCISQIDHAIGQVISHLEHRGLLEDTVIIYTADHGDLCGDRRMMDKHYVMYDEVVRVPLVIRYPACIRPGQRCSEMVTNMLDLVPTILTLAGLDVPEGLDAVTLWPYLVGEPHPSPRRYALTTYNGQQCGLYTQRMLRSHTWKYVWNPTDVDELYDMVHDPYELHNLAHDSAYADVLSDMRVALCEELEAVEDYTMRSPWLRDQLLLGRKQS